MTNNELKPCPFCGGEASFEQHKMRDFDVMVYYVRCCRCGCSTSRYVERSPAATMWNTRKGEKINGNN